MDEILLLDTYCERAYDGLWAEPLNAVSNVAFIIAAWAAWRLHRTVEDGGSARQWDIVLLIAITAAIGIGSGLWHTFATPWAFLLDIVPIGLFISLYLLSFLVRVARAPWWSVLIVFAAYQGAHYGLIATVPRGTLHGSVYYFPAWLFLAGMTALLYLRDERMWRQLALACVLLAASLTLRSIDLPLCDVVPVGTHFLWHVFNGALLYTVLRALIQGTARPGSGAASGRTR